MAQIFHPSLNTVSRATIFGAVFILGAAAFGWDSLLRSPYVTQVGVARDQPVPFSHKHHVGGLGMDCRYCHSYVEESSSAGMPSTKVCMTCHSMVWNDSEMLAPVRESYAEDRSIEWTRVHDLPDFAYFDHSIHISKGVSCTSCHGAVNEMPLMWREASLQMDWCLSCHRDPQKYIGPRDRVFDPDFHPFDLDLETRQALAEENRVESLINCSVCHR